MPHGCGLVLLLSPLFTQLGERGSVETILGLLKETPILQFIAEAICGHAQELVAELVAAREEAERAEREEAERLRQEAEAAGGASRTTAGRWSSIHKSATKKSGFMHAVQQSKLAKQQQEAPRTAAELNEAMRKKGAFTLSCARSSNSILSPLPHHTVSRASLRSFFAFLG